MIRITMRPALIFVCLYGCGTPAMSATSPPRVVVMDADEAAVCEATFRWMFLNNASGMRTRAELYCLELDNKSDPTPAFISRFAQEPMLVRAASSCIQSPRTGVIDRATHVRGLALRIVSVTFDDPDHATVYGGYYSGFALSSSGNTYTLERQKGVWVVVNDELNVIS